MVYFYNRLTTTLPCTTYLHLIDKFVSLANKEDIQKPEEEFKHKMHFARRTTAQASRKNGINI